MVDGGLRPGQAEALRLWEQALQGGSRSELVVVPVGYGKTVIGVGSFVVASEVAEADFCLYLTPTDVLRAQVFGGVERAIRLVERPLPVRKALADNAAPQRMISAGANFVVASYQQVVAAPGIYQQICKKRRVHVVCDEAHHLGERGRWAAAIASMDSVSRILLSATPVRLDRDALLGARYEEMVEGEVVAPLLHVSMRQAWTERRILKHLNMQMKDYSVQLQDGEGRVLEFTASEMAELTGFDQRCVRQQLRWNEDYVAPLVREFAVTLQTKMLMAPGQHQGLVFAATTEHANHLERVFARFHPSLRCAVIHSGDIADAENDRRLRGFHSGRYDVLIQVRKASEGFDAPAVSVLLKLDAVFSREPVIQQFGRGLRYNHNLVEAENMLNIFVGRDPRLGPIIEHLEREAPLPAVQRRAGEDSSPRVASKDEEDANAFEDEDEQPRLEITDVSEAGDAYLDHTGRFIEGQQLTLFGGSGSQPAASRAAAAPSRAEEPVRLEVDVFDLAAELQQAVDFCKLWTNRAAKERSRRLAGTQNHHAALNLTYGQASGKRGALSTAAEYRAKGEWMKRQYGQFLP